MNYNPKDGFPYYFELAKKNSLQYEISLEEFLRSIIGHEKHHMNIIQEKYQLE